MMQAGYHIDIKDQSGVKIDELTPTDGRLRELQYRHRVNRVGVGGWDMVGNNDLAETIKAASSQDYQAEFWRTVPNAGLVWYKEWEGFIRDWDSEITKNGENILTVACESYLTMLAQSILYPEGSAQSNKSAATETVMKELVDENCGVSATSPPRDYANVMAGLTVQADTALGAVYSAEMARGQLLKTLYDIAAFGNIDFDVVGTGAATFEFRTYPGQRGLDRSYINVNPGTGLNFAGNDPAKFGITEGNVSRSVYRRIVRDSLNVVEAVGGTVGAARAYRVRTDAGAMALSPWAHREGVVNAGQETTNAGLDAAADAELAKNGIDERFALDIIQTPTSCYGLHYSWGDIVTLIHHEFVGHKKLVEVRVKAKDRDEELKFTNGDLSQADRLSPQGKLAFMLDRLQQRVDQMARYEL